MTVVTRRAYPEEFKTLLEFYRENGYPLEVNPSDTFYVALTEGELIGIVRLAQEFGFTVLRGMRVSPRWQRSGVGSRLLRLLEQDLVGKECYCLPYAHLVGFYGQIGFQSIDLAEAPEHLQERIGRYRALQNGNQYTLMYRAPRTGPI